MPKKRLVKKTARKKKGPALPPIEHAIAFDRRYPPYQAGETCIKR